MNRALTNGYVMIMPKCQLNRLPQTNILFNTECI